MTEDHMYWSLVMERWVFLGGEDVHKIFPPFYPKWIPNFLVKRFFKQLGDQVGIMHT